MKYEAVKELLERYWDGETSLQEEQQIKAYFNAGNIDQRLESIAPLFQAIREEKALQMATKAKSVTIRPQMYGWAMAASLALLLSAAWWMFREDKLAAPLANEVPTEQPKINVKPSVKALEAYVALEEKQPEKPTLQKRKNKIRKPKSNPEIDAETAQAMAEIKAALSLVSSKLDKGRNKAIQCATNLEVLEKVPKRKDG